MKKCDFVQMGLPYRYALLQEKGKKLFTLHYPQSVIHIYALGDFYVELKLDPGRYSIVSADVFDETHPRYHEYMEKMEAEGKVFSLVKPRWMVKTKRAMLKETA